MQYLVHIKGPGVDVSFPIERTTPAAVIGRGADATVPLPNTDKSVSRRHLGIAWAEGGVTLSVLSEKVSVQTTQGVLGPGASCVLAAGDNAEFGPYELEVRGGAAQEAFAPRPAQHAAESNPFRRFDTPAPRAEEADPLAALSPLASLRPATPGGFSTGGCSTGGFSTGGFSEGGFPAAEAPTGPRPRGFDPDDLLRSLDPVERGRSKGSSIIDGLIGVGSGGKAVEPTPPRGIEREHAWHEPFLPPAPPRAAPQPIAQPAADDEAARIEQLLMQRGWARGPAATPPSAAAQEVRVPDGPAVRTPPPPPPMAARRPAPQPGEATMPRPSAATASTGATGAIGAAAGAAAAGFWKGVGVQPDRELREEDWESIGRSVASMVDMLSELLTARAELKRELRAPERTVLGMQDGNPLKLGLARAEMLRYLLLRAGALRGGMEPDAAVRECTADLRAHEFAVLAGCRAAIQGVLRDFSPRAIEASVERKPLLPLGRSGANWDAYVRSYEVREADPADWLESVFAQHFMPAYAAEVARLRGGR